MKLHYYQSNNFGDALSPKIVEKLCGCYVEYADPYKADMVAAGSVLYTGHWLFRDGEYNRTLRGSISFFRIKMKTRKIPIKIWGSGFLEYPSFPQRIDIIRSMEIFALRGRVSHQILDRLGICPITKKIVYGDPGLLYPMLLDSMPKKEYDIGIIPHYFDKEKGIAIFNAINSTDIKALLIDVLDNDPVETIRRIAKCETILSSSLHGCIVADSLEIPNRQMTLSTFNLNQENYLLKYKDYYSAYGLEMPQPLKINDILENVKRIQSKIIQEYCVPKDGIENVKSALKASFPL